MVGSPSLACITGTAAALPVVETEGQRGPDRADLARHKGIHNLYFVLAENPNTEDNLLGIFRVPAKVRNWQNRFLPPGEVSCDMLVNSGAAELIDLLKLEELGASAHAAS